MNQYYSAFETKDYNKTQLLSDLMILFREYFLFTKMNTRVKIYPNTVNLCYETYKRAKGWLFTWEMVNENFLFFRFFDFSRRFDFFDFKAIFRFYYWLLSIFSTAF